MRIIRYIIAFVIVVIASCADREQMLRQLEQAEQQNRDYVAFTSDSLALSLTDYFDSHGTANERMRAHYILGCAYRDLGEAPRALECYNDAVECADTTAKDCDFKTLSRVYGQMSYVYESKSSPVDAICAERKAVRYAYAASDSLGAVMYEENLLGLYDMNGSEDSIHAITARVRQKYLDLGHTDLAASCLYSEIVILLRNGENSRAKRLMDIYDTESGLVDDGGDMTQGGPDLYYYAKGNYYNNIGKIDSSLHYYYRLSACKQHLDCMEAAAKGLLSVYDKMGAKDSITKYANLYSHINDSSNFVRASEEAQRQKAVYNYENSNRKLEIAHRSISHIRITIAVISLAAIAAISLLVFSYKRKIKRERNDMIAKNKLYSELLAKYKTAKEEMQNHGEDIKTKEHQIAILKTEIQKYQEEIGIRSVMEMEECHIDSPLTNKLHSMASDGKTAPEYLMFEFQTYVENNDSSYLRQLSDEKYNLTPKEKLVAMLIRYRFIPSETACLLGVTLQRVTNIRRNINKKIFKQNDTKSLEFNLYRL